MMRLLRCKQIQEQFSSSMKISYFLGKNLHFFTLKYGSCTCISSILNLRFTFPKIQKLCALFSSLFFGPWYYISSYLFSANCKEWTNWNITYTLCMYVWEDIGHCQIYINNINLHMKTSNFGLHHEMINSFINILPNRHIYLIHLLILLKKKEEEEEESFFKKILKKEK